MRPRHKAAEYEKVTLLKSHNRRASMRPRHKAAEYRRVCRDAAQHRDASMRPRHKAAEYARLLWQLVIVYGGFNEAAA